MSTSSSSTSSNININFDVLNRALDAIEANPERWNQGSWLAFAPDVTAQEINSIENPDEAMCKTVACLAGWTLLTDNRFTTILTQETEYQAKSLKFIDRLNGDTFSDYEFDPTTGRSLVAVKAAKTLGIDDLEETDSLAYELFYQTHSSQSPQEFRVDVYRRIANHLQRRLLDAEERIEQMENANKPLPNDLWADDKATAYDEPPF